MTAPEKPDRTYLFESSHHAYWAEDLAREDGITVELVPAPTGADALCGMALKIPEERSDRLEEVFRGEGIPYTVVD